MKIIKFPKNSCYFFFKSWIFFNFLSCPEKCPLFASRLESHVTQHCVFLMYAHLFNLLYVLSLASEICNGNHRKQNKKVMTLTVAFVIFQLSFLQPIIRDKPVVICKKIVTHFKIKTFVQLF